jgi:hypothetical protein
MSSHISHSIQSRTTPNDVFYTPESAVIKHLSLIHHNPTDKWLDPFLGQGAYYDRFPTENKDWTEISKGRDFFDYTGHADIICSNPPYSMIDLVLEKSVQVKPRIISYLIGQGNLTPKRIAYMNQQGYGLTHIHMLKIFKWYGISYIVVFEKGGSNCVSFDRIVHK